jgi:hypothetical protein
MASRLMFSAKLRLASRMPADHRRKYCAMLAGALHLLPLMEVPVRAFT